MESFDEVLTCSICLEFYNSPFSLPCQHTFCRDCLRNCETDECPMCRRRYDQLILFDDSCINRNIQSLIQHYQQQGQTRINQGFNNNYHRNSFNSGFQFDVQDPTIYRAQPKLSTQIKNTIKDFAENIKRNAKVIRFLGVLAIIFNIFVYNTYFVVIGNYNDEYNLYKILLSLLMLVNIVKINNQQSNRKLSENRITLSLLIGMTWWTMIGPAYISNSINYIGSLVGSTSLVTSLFLF